MYTIGQVSERFDLPVSTLRYYDKEGLFPKPDAGHIGCPPLRRAGARGAARVECLKRSGLEIREIRQFMECARRARHVSPAACTLCAAAERVEARSLPAEVAGHDPLQVLVL